MDKQLLLGSPSSSSSHEQLVMVANTVKLCCEDSCATTKLALFDWQQKI
jgi:hypothetical protein